MNKGRLIELSGQRFGRLLVLSRDDNRPRGDKAPAYWWAKCDCGKIVSVVGKNLRNGNTKSCGCLHKETVNKPRSRDLTNEVFGRLIVIERLPEDYYRANCECGNEKIVKGAYLRNGDTKSCGCLVVDATKARSKKHGRSRSPEYTIWLSMKQRCINPNNKCFKDYGARGISVCARWINSFENFIEDVGVRPSKKHSIDRINNNGNYEPGNVVWSTPQEQANNTRKNVYLTFQGQTLTASQWAFQLDIDPALITARKSYGWSDERALTTEPIIGRNQFMD